MRNDSGGGRYILPGCPLPGQIIIEGGIMLKTVGKQATFIFILSFLLIIVSVVSASAVNHSTEKINGKTYTHPKQLRGSNYAIFHGVDISAWNDAGINLKKVKKSGVDFAIIRCGYTNLNRFNMHEDVHYATYIKKAKAAGVNFGVYYYSACTTKDEAVQEAKYTLKILKKYKIQPNMPVVMDFEFGEGRQQNTYYSWVRNKGTAYARKRLTANAVAYMQVIKNAGYIPMFYSYRALVDWDSRAFNMGSLKPYFFWLAQYASTTTYKGNIDYWQYSSTGKVAGLDGNIDRNFYYFNKNGRGTENGKKNIHKTKIKLGYTQVKYDGKIKQPSVTVTDGTKKLVKDKDYLVQYFQNVKKGTAYVLVIGKGSYSNTNYKTFKIVTKVTKTPAKKTTNTTNKTTNTTNKTTTNTTNKKTNSTTNKTTNKTTNNTTNKNNTNSSAGKTTSGSSAEKNAANNNTSKNNTTNNNATKNNAQNGTAAKTSAKPAEVMKIQTTVNSEKNTLSINFNASENAADYRISYNVNGGQWTEFTTGGGTSCTIPFMANDLVRFRIRAERTENGKLIAGDYSGIKNRLIAKSVISEITSAKGKMTVNYKKLNVDKYQINYSLYPTMKDYKTVYVQGAGNLKTTISKLVSGKKYYVKLRGIKRVNKVNYYTPYGNYTEIMVK
jgi:GH25 family lysozyme M1 (1,4-beta-N-acetylmuramidase)